MRTPKPLKLPANITNKRLRAFVLVCALMLTGSALRAQPENLLSNLDYFEGTIQYKISLSGPRAEYIRTLNNITLMTVHIKDNNYIVYEYGMPDHKEPFSPNDPKLEINQVLENTRVFLADSNEDYIVDVENRRFFKYDSYELQLKLDSNLVGRKHVPEAVPTGDSVMILDVLCEKYRVEKEDEVIYYFVSPRYRVDLKQFEGLTKARISFLTPGLQGKIPLRTIRKKKNGHLVIDIKATGITVRELHKNQFLIPKSFEFYLTDPRR